jgi:AAA-like domain/CHAT domain
LKLKKILILTANPKNTDKLRLDEEVREIQAGLERARSRDQFEIISRWAVRPDDLRRSLLDHEPQIVHFSGHGAGSQGLALEDNAGQMQLVSSGALARLFGLFKDKVECVLLNACYSEDQAEAIHQHIDWVIGMNQAIGDRAAIKFAVGFYDALGAGRSIEDAFEFGLTAIDLESIPESSTPVIKGKKQVSEHSVARDIGPQSYLPLSVIPLEDPEGSVPLESSFYVERPPIEDDCYERILRPGALIRIKAPRQMGKSSLMVRILHHAKQQGYQTADLNLQSADTELLTDLDRFLQWFCASVAEALNLPDQLSDYWKGVLGSKNKCTKYFERYLLTTFDSPLVLALDEVDQIFLHKDIATNFFGLLRTWNEQSKNEDLWKKLRLILVHSKEVYIPLHINQSPFNVGFAVELRELSLAQVQELIQRHGLQWTMAQTEQLMELVGGHPYLVRGALYQIARQRMTLGDLLKAAPTEEGLYGEHLRRHLLNLESDKDLVAALYQVVSANQPVQIGTAEAFRLQSMGLVKYQGNAVVPLCNLYRQYFRDRLKH